jgi:hypothetical protein
MGEDTSRRCVVKVPADPGKLKRAELVALLSNAEPPPRRALADGFRAGMTVSLGVGIPLLSLAMSRLSGTLAAHGHLALAAFALGLMAAVLGVSLSHLAWAIGDITRSGPRASWSLAVALDLSLVLSELVHVYAPGLGLAWVTCGVMVSVAAASMALNCYAFLMHEDAGPAAD